MESFAPENKEDSGASDRDDSMDEDMEALRRACSIAGTSPGDTDFRNGGESSDSEDDLNLLRSIQRRFSLPSVNAVDDLSPSRPLNFMFPTDSDEEDDFETLRAIQRRFMHYENDSVKSHREGISCEAALSNNRADMPLHQEYNLQLVDKAITSVPRVNLENLVDISAEEHAVEEGACHFASGEPAYSRFPKCAETFVNALKANRSCQKFIRQKLMVIEARVEQNKLLKERVKCLMDFQAASRKRTNQALNQKKDPRIRFISLPKTKSKSASKEDGNHQYGRQCQRIRGLSCNSMCIPVSCKVIAGKPSQCGPPENHHVSKYRMVLSRFPISLYKRKWSEAEKENLLKGIKQQYQEMVFLNMMEPTSHLEEPVGDSAIVLRNNFDFSSEDIRSFVPLVNWERLASMYLPGRSGRECEARWLNNDDPLINHSSWTILEEKKLLHIVQNRGIYNWIEIVVLLGTFRTPFQCLLRYQRSLNPCIIKKEWTKEEDAQLRAAVEAFGDDNWQLVASSLEGRTGPQCSNRWRKSLIERKVGRWSIDEDKRLKVAVMLFGAKNWNKISLFISGRTQSQCRERWVNCLDPTLNLQAWTEEEDIKLTEAIARYGYCWSKIASFVPPRTDNQCWRRWKVLYREEVPLRQATWKMQKAVLITNFVDRESERPLIGPSDFHHSLVHTDADVNVCDASTRKRKMRKQPNSKNQGDLTPSGSRKHKPKIMKENATLGDQAVCPRKLKGKIEHFKDNETIANCLEVIKHRTISKKRTKGPDRQHKKLDNHSRSKSKQISKSSGDFIPAMLSDVAGSTADIVPSSSIATLRQSYTRSSKTKAKSFLNQLIRNGMEESSVCISRSGKRKRSVSTISDGEATMLSREHNHRESSIGGTILGASVSGVVDDINQSTLTLKERADGSGNCVVMPTPEGNSSTNGQEKLPEQTGSRREVGVL